MLWNPKVEASVFLSGMWCCVTGWLVPDVWDNVVVSSSRVEMPMKKSFITDNFDRLPIQHVCVLLFLFAEEHSRQSCLKCCKRLECIQTTLDSRTHRGEVVLKLLGLHTALVMLWNVFCCWVLHLGSFNATTGSCLPQHCLYMGRCC